MTFACVPVCASCRTSGECQKPEEAKSWAKAQEVHHPTVTQMYGRPIQMPCGCCEIPIGLFHVLGEDIDSWFCERHGWQKLTRTAKTRGRKAAADAYARYVRELTGVKQLPLPMPEVPPFLYIRY